MASVSISGLWLYPVKSMAGQAVSELIFDAHGPVGDRRWMVTGPDGRFLSQRKWPLLAAFTPVEQNSVLTITAPDDTAVSVSADECVTEAQATVWRDSVSVRVAPESVNRWLSEWLGAKVQLVRYREDRPRPTDRTYADALVGFADGFPLLVCFQPSLERLSEAVGRSLPIQRFRPNVLVDSDRLAAWDEQSWLSLCGESVSLSLVKPCTRCVIITQDPVTRARDPSILRVLTRENPLDGQAVFGMNGVLTGGQELRLGDRLAISR